MLGQVASPVSFMGPERFNDKLPIALEDLPFIDAVLYSHDHYDHLDYGTVLKIKDKVGHWFTALGMGSHLKRWGVDSKKITELDWWQESEFMGLKLAATPARHFSGRGFGDRFKTFWNSWVVIGQHQKLYFSGDGGYSKGFKEIGDKYGPFDLCLIECGAYNEAWQDIHMMPEESAQACVDLQGRLMMPIHWGAFSLALHDWTDPVQRLSIKAEELGVKLVTPLIGEEVIVPVFLPNDAWWNAVKN
jgi:L-ascorbate metabolism protein UlaG (beta-lactamase superfamily)